MTFILFVTIMIQITNYIKNNLSFFVISTLKTQKD